MQHHITPCIHALHVLPLVCLFVYLFTFVISTHAACFVCLFPLLVVSVIDRQQADTNSNCTHHIRRGLGRRLRSSLLLNPSPSTSRDTSLSRLAEIHWSLAISMHSDTVQEFSHSEYADDWQQLYNVFNQWSKKPDCINDWH